MTVTPILQPDPAVPRGGAAPRWYPTRAGILNVWRYYDEVFEFHNGRLLLRGPNGSGKSKVLEVLLPYLLDASLKPSRLSTFGGSERTMHWNLMGDGHMGSTRVGYVWLEFHHPGDDHQPPRWFTCGARLQATANTKSVTPAYFTTSQRVGMPQGLSLTQDDGRPLTRAHLDAAIGDSGDVHESPDGYRTVVRHTLYGRLSVQRYESLLTALRQLRTPKLSERLDPGLLSELLSSALPPLAEGEIREIAEGFERLDRQRDDLKALDRQVETAAELARLQRTYAGRVLRAGSGALISATSAMDSLGAQVKGATEAFETAKAERDRTETRIADLQAEEQRLSSRIEGLKEREAYRAGRDLDKARQAANDAERAAAASRGEADHLARQAGARRAEANTVAISVGERRGLRDQAAIEAAHAAERADMPVMYDEAASRSGEATAESIREARRLLHAAVDSRNGQISQVRTALGKHDGAVTRRNEAEEERDESRERHADAIQDRDRAHDAHAEAVDALARLLRDWAHRCRELAPLDADALADRAASYQDVEELVVTARTRAAARFAAAESELKRRLAELSEQAGALRAEREALEREVDLPPDAPRTRGGNRAARPGSPLWRLVAFRDGIAPDVQAGVEAALEASGLLDAWVMPDGGLITAEQDTFVPVALTKPAPRSSLADVLMAEPDCPVPEELTRGLLAGIAYVPNSAGDLDHPAAVGADGTWRLAAAAGRWAKPEPAHIGAAARERARRRRIAELDDQIAGLEQGISRCETAMSGIDQRRAVLDTELGDRPRHQPVHVAYQALEKSELTVAHRHENLERQEGRLRDWEKRVATALRELTALASGHHLPTNASALDTLAAAVRAVHGIGGTWLDRCEEVRAAEESAAGLDRTAGEYEAIADAAARRAEADSATAADLAEKLAVLEETVGVEHQQVLDQLNQVRGEWRTCEHELGEQRDRLSDLREALGEHRMRAEDVKRRQEEAVEERDRSAERFRHLLGGHLPTDARLDVTLAAGDGVKATLESARAIAAALDRVPHEPRNLRDAESRLAEAIHRSRDTLSDRADLELVPDDEIRIFTATMDGIRIGAARLHESLREEREQRKADITDKERDLFDRTLAGDTRRHLADRIRQANDLVDGMNRRLERVRTASRVSVRLVWQVDPQQLPGTRAARDLLLKDPADLNEQNRQALYRFFRERVAEAQAANTASSWEEQLMQVLDYTKWHRFTVRLNRDDGTGWQDLTKRMHGALSGGEKAIALHLPLFAAVAAHYQTDPASPRFILLDEVFVGVDTANRGQVFELLVDLGLDLVLTSDHEWCDYRELDGIAVHQLITGNDRDEDNAVTTARFIWNGYRIVPGDDPDDAAESELLLE